MPAEPIRITRRIAGACEGGPCPNVYELSDQSYLFQGDEVTDPEVVGSIEMSPGERLVRLPAEVVHQLVSRLTAQSATTDVGA